MLSTVQLFGMGLCQIEGLATTHSLNNVMDVAATQMARLDSINQTFAINHEYEFFGSNAWPSRAYLHPQRISSREGVAEEVRTVHSLWQTLHEVRPLVSLRNIYLVDLTLISLKYYLGSLPIDETEGLYPQIAAFEVMFEGEISRPIQGQELSPEQINDVASQVFDFMKLASYRNYKWLKGQVASAKAEFLAAIQEYPTEVNQLPLEPEAFIRLQSKMATLHQKIVDIKTRYLPNSIDQVKAAWERHPLKDPRRAKSP